MFSDFLNGCHISWACILMILFTDILPVKHFDMTTQKSVFAHVSTQYEVLCVFCVHVWVNG
uniref:Uncharacterized protein n=1 Tax=Anguilla anguilla TaxID=7936 RepID=A0A0E9XPH1_ANGAN